MFALVHARMVLAHEALPGRVHVHLPGHAPFRVAVDRDSGRRARHVEIVQHHAEEGREEFRTPQNAAGAHAHLQAAAEIEGICEPRIHRNAVQPLEHFRVASGAAGGNRDLSPHQVHPAAQGVLHHHARDGAVGILNEFLRVGAHQEFDRALAGQIHEFGQEHSQDRHPVPRRPLIAPHPVRFVASGGHRVVGQGREPVIAEPVHRPGRLAHEHTGQFGVHLAAADAHDVVKVGFRRILDALFRLDTRSRRGDLPRRAIQRSPQPVGPVHYQHPRALPGREDRARQTRRSSAHHDQVPGLARRPADARQQSQCRRRSRPREQFPLA